ncbi:hypothetical protein BJ138DRAFT_1133957 [Hygrophoropsis aurantiaca]|uniref:Uncharacterized protein n=1 Tax=Hygrophoropsis aurantiaca TaxID=72124 RepID=A0ACB8AJL0_9AGAM|nr:hypothetical protein BJ138DRAFT_1133957 [Hygrophoropsis aurantiaca]
MAASRIPENSPVSAFLSKYGGSTEIFVTHLDTTTVSDRKKHFLVLLGLNVASVALLLKRAYGGFYRYGILFLLGKLVGKSGAVPPVLGLPFAGQLCLDLFIFLFLLPIIYFFITGPALLRYHHGYPQPEIVFRKLTTSTLASILATSADKRDAYLGELLRRGVEPTELKQPLYGMPWEEWEINYPAMRAAHDSAIKADTWKLAVWMKMKEGWTVVDHGKKDDPQAFSGMMEKLYDKLVAMGKRQVFEQLIEVIQVKTVSKDGKPLPVTDEVDAIIADIFERNGVDMDELTKGLGPGAPSFLSSNKASKSTKSRRS